MGNAVQNCELDCLIKAGHLSFMLVSLANLCVERSLVFGSDSLAILKKLADFDLLIVMKWQFVQFLLKQAGVDKRTGDLYGNRYLLNIARNMARGLKVWAAK